MEIADPMEQERQAQSAPDLGELVKSLAERFKTPSWLGVTLAVALTSVLYIYQPFLTGNSHVRVERRRENLLLRLDPAFRTVTVRFSGTVYVDSYTVRPDSLTAAFGVVRRVIRRNIKSITSTVKIENLLSDSERKSGDFVTASVDVDRTRVTVEILGLQIDGRELSLEEIRNDAVFNKEKAIVRSRSIQDDVAKLLRGYNTGVSNAAMTVMATVCVLVLIYLARAAGRTRSVTGIQKQLKEQHTDTELTINLEETRMICVERLWRRQVWWQFVEVLGPALGFIMTISSLVVALQAPAVRGGQDMGEFFVSVEIALISTFLGLLLRIVALILDRMDSDYIVLLDGAFNDLAAKRKVSEPHAGTGGAV
jgi:hypothetical protein